MPKFQISALPPILLGLGLVVAVTLSLQVYGQPTPKPAPKLLLPAPTANNAVAIVNSSSGSKLYSFMGLGPGKTYRDVHSNAVEVDIASGTVSALDPVPGNAGRLAGIAVTLGNQIYIFGGYTVASDGGEKSSPSVNRFDPETQTYQAMAPMPVPVDDTVALPYQERFIYLVSGWHDTDNVPLVQVFDTCENVWFRASDYPGPPVFGHAGGIVDGIFGGRMIIADGVKVVPRDEGRYKASATVYLGEIDPGDPAKIAWKELPAHPGKALYRMAAAGDPADNRVLFAGGSTNPYNFNGIGYNGMPSAPSDRVFAYQLDTGSWQEVTRTPVATMDHRGLLLDGNDAYIVGGMLDGQVVSNRVIHIRLPH